LEKKVEMATPESLQFQPPHPLNEKETQFRKSLPPREKELHQLATEMLGSSYFTGKTHGFTAWFQSSRLNTNPTKPPQGVK
jgi:hypothetical protein